jgi:DNA repair protein RecO (recombination protein O)
MEKYKTEGIVINAIPFRNYDCILTVFTPTEGLIKFFYRGAYSQKKNHGSGTTTPLSIVEIIYTKGRGDLYTCVEAAVLDHHLALRNTLNTLGAACGMIQAIATTQQPGKSAPELYQLLQMYLRKLPLVTDPQTIIGSFRLKLLRYEGMMAFLSHCCVCAKTLDEAWLHDQEAYCHSHTPSKDFLLDKEERSIVEYLAFGRDFSLLAEITLPESLAKKISLLFDESLK